MSSLVYGEQGAFLSSVVSFHSGSVSKAGLKREPHWFAASSSKVSFWLMEAVYWKSRSGFLASKVQSWYLDGFSLLFFHNVIKGLRGHPGRGERTRVHVRSSEPVESLQQDISVASGLQERSGCVFCTEWKRRIWEGWSPSGFKS